MSGARDRAAGRVPDAAPPAPSTMRTPERVAPLPLSGVRAPRPAAASSPTPSAARPLSPLHATYPPLTLQAHPTPPCRPLLAAALRCAAPPSRRVPDAAPSCVVAARPGRGGASAHARRARRAPTSDPARAFIPAAPQNVTSQTQRPVSTAAGRHDLKLGIWVMNSMGPLPVRK